MCSVDKLLNILNKDKEDKGSTMKTDISPPPRPSAANTSSLPVAKKDDVLSSAKQKSTAAPAVVTSKVAQPTNSKSAVASTDQAESYVFDAMYDRMLKMKLPETAIRKKMKGDGVPPEAIDIFFRDHVGL
jgi:hypothetical protein